MLGSKASAAIESKVNDKEMKKKSKIKKMKLKSSKQSETLENSLIDPKTVAKGKNRQMLLSSITAFLDSNGFHKTLVVFRSETQLEVLKEHVCDHDASRVFLSDEKNDNALNLLLKKFEYFVSLQRLVYLSRRKRF